jgi:hypothetical protein
MLKKPGLSLLFGSVILFGLMYCRSIIDGDWFNSFSLYPQNSIIAPLELVSFILIPTALYLLLFNPTIQQVWWRWARFALLVPFALIILLLPTYQNGGGFITFGGTTDLVILWGAVFVVATLITTLYHRFYRKTGISN